MARLPYLEADQVAPEYRDMLKRNTNLHKLLVNSPDMARAFNGIGSYIRFKSKLDPRLRELANLQVGWMEKSEYEFTHHVKIGKEFGVTDADIEALLAETEGKPSGLEPLARAVGALQGQAGVARQRVGGVIGGVGCADATASVEQGSRNQREEERAHGSRRRAPGLLAPAAARQVAREDLAGRPDQDEDDSEEDAYDQLPPAVWPG